MRPVRRELCELQSHAYVISAAGARKLVAWAEFEGGRVDRGVDCWMTDGVPTVDVWATWDLLCYSVPALQAGAAAGGSATDIATPELIDVSTGGRRNKTRKAELAAEL